MSESAVVLLVPEAERAVQALRARHDPVASRGMPAHVTLLYPFLPAAAVDSAVMKRLRDYFAACAPLRFTLGDVRHFPDAVYLAPEPVTPIVRWIEGLASLFPETPPYGGRFDTIIPHLTVAQGSDAALHAEVAAELAAALPIEVVCNQAALVVEERGVWRAEAVFPAGGR